jgi:thiamine-monophosphate kinase
MNELELIETIRRRAGRPFRAGMLAGIGDDCAVFRPSPKRGDLVFTTDLLLEEVHFRPATHSAADVGHKALARGLSDIAAMGGRPVFCLVSLAVPDWAGARWIGGFYRGLLSLARAHRTLLAGGDLARARQFACDIIVCGLVPRGAALRRDTARAGDEIWVSGLLGGSALGLALGRGAAWARHRRPAPRIALGVSLRRLGATSAMDLSDGLSLDLHRLARESGVAAAIDRPLPVFHGATLEQALHGGEDYELVFTVPPGRKIPGRLHGVPLTRLGTMVAGESGAVWFFGRRLPRRGYDHFRAGATPGASARRA